MTKGEAQALNALRAENIRNNKMDRIKERLAGLVPGELLEPSAIAELQREIADYDKRYRFVERGASRARPGLLEETALELAREAVRLDSRSKDLSEEGMEAQAQALAETSEIRQLAHARAEAKSQAAVASLQELLA